jgi:hypothetical protein
MVMGPDLFKLDRDRLETLCGDSASNKLEGLKVSRGSAENPSTWGPESPKEP